MATQYLKDILALIPEKTLTAKVEKIGEREQNRNKKWFRTVTFVFPSTGRSHEEGVFDFNFQPPRGNLQNLKVGDTVEMKLEDGWPIFRILTATAEQAIVQPSQTPYQQVNSERAATKVITEREEKDAIHDNKLGLAGIVQAQLIRGMGADEITGQELQGNPTAEEWVRWIRRKAREMHLRIKIPTPIIPITDSSMTAEEVRQTFGTDFTLPENDPR